MARVERTALAREDLVEIVRYIAQDRETAAIAWLQEIEATFWRLAAQPLMGQRCVARRRVMRRFTHGNYVIYFRPLPSGVEILRVLHAAREHDPLLKW